MKLDALSGYILYICLGPLGPVRSVLGPMRWTEEVEPVPEFSRTDKSRSVRSKEFFVGPRSVSVQRRTYELLAEAARLLQLPATADRVEKWLGSMHAPTGIDVGADTPAAIALSILAEIQQTLGARYRSAGCVPRATRAIGARC